jgi:hypothetical protein
MPVRAHLPGYRRLGAVQNAAVRTGVYSGVGMALIFTTWVFVANRIPTLEIFALERNLAGAVALGLFAAIPIFRFIRFPGHLLSSSLVGWTIFSLTYRLLCIHFWGLAARHSAVQIFTLGAVVYMILATIAWIGTCIWRAREAGISHSKHHVS